MMVCGSIAQAVRAPNSSHEVASSMPTVDISLFVSLKKTLNTVIPIDSDAARWIRAQVGNRKIVDSWLDS